MSATSQPACFLTAEWRHLVMLNYECDPARLTSLVPAGTELDQFAGRTFVSLVGFQFLRTRVLGVPIPFHRDFEEVNLRCYVRRRGPDGWRRGVVFVRELVPRAAIAWVARVFYHEPYLALPMTHELREESGGEKIHVEYRWRLAGRWHRLGAAAVGVAREPVPGSLEEFITEHYWGYTAQPDGGCLEYQVEHPRWRVRHAEGSWFEGDAGALSGPALAGALAAPPASAFIADGSPVTVRRGARI